VSTALKDVDGVYSVDATYEPPEAVVRFDPAATSVDRLTTATENVGFSAHPQSDS
jgi:copper chaperone CopZ